MADSDKNILITPNTNQSGFPNIQFVGSSSAPISLNVLDDNSISFSGSEGQLFSINNNLTSGTIFSVNDVSGIPLIEADADGTVSLAEFGGNVGIGTASPTYKLSVTGTLGVSGATTLTSVSGTTAEFTSITSSLQGNASSATNATNATNTTNVALTAWGTSANYKVPFANTVGNTTVTTGLFHDNAGQFTYNPFTNTLNATFFNGTATNASNVSLTATNTTNAAHYVTFVDTATGNETIRTDTDLTYNPSSNTLTVGTLVETSTREIKENIKTIPNQLSKLKKLNPVRYNKINSTRDEIGLIAEEVQEVYPEFVHDKGINYPKMVSVLISAVQELTGKVEKQQREISSLKNKIKG